MAAKGEITPMPDCAIFADTGWEPRTVYEHLAWSYRQLGIHVRRTSRSETELDSLAERMVGRNQSQ